MGTIQRPAFIFQHTDLQSVSGEKVKALQVKNPKGIKEGMKKN